MSEIPNFWLLGNFTDASISDIHTCVKVYTSCQYGAFFTKSILSLIRPIIASFLRFLIYSKFSTKGFFHELLTFSASLVLITYIDKVYIQCVPKKSTLITIGYFL
jgi:hypothetical protein